MRVSVIQCVLVLSGVLSAAHAREWSDRSGTYRLEGDLFAASEDTVIVRLKNGDLHAYQVEQMSDADREFVKQHLAAVESDQQNGAVIEKKMQTWTSRSGFRFRARVLGYGSGDVNLQWKRSKVYVNDKPIDELDQIYQMMVPKLVAEYDDRKVQTDAELIEWARRLRGKVKTFHVDGVRIRMENGEEIAVPLFLFSEEERTALEEGWEHWKHMDTSEREKERESFLARAQAESWQQQRAAEAQEQKRIQMMQLELLAVNAGIVQLWEVMIFPGPGVMGRPTSVVVPANNSADAAGLALQRYPGFQIRAVRQVSYRL